MPQSMWPVMLEGNPQSHQAIAYQIIKRTVNGCGNP